MDVYYINHDFKAEFRSFRKDTSSLKKDTSIISLKDKSGATERFYYYNGDLYSSREISLYETDQGYALLRYLDMNLLSLNKNNSMITDEKIDNNVYYRSGFLGDLYFSGNNDYFSRRNSGHYQDSVAFFHCYEEQPYGAWVNKTEKYIRQQSRRTKDNFLIMKYDFKSQKCDKPFGRYPAVSADSFAYFSPNIVNYSAYEQDAVYLSFGGDPGIIKYDYNGNEIEKYNFPGKNIRPDKLKFPVIIKSALRYGEFYNNYLDSYGEMYKSENLLFRKYNLAQDPDAIAEYKLPNDFKGCIPGKMADAWGAIHYDKKSYLQQIDLDTKNVIEFEYPEGMDIFVAYNSIKKEYYFRKDAFRYNPGAPAVIYVYKAEDKYSTKD